jgi:hypothetical protein
MADDLKLEVFSGEAKALEIASAMVQQTYPHQIADGKPKGVRWVGVDMADDGQVRARLEMLADLIGDLKKKLLK